MEIKIQCPCGTRYKFDVEPVNGLMPGPIFCPTCSLEGTEAGNSILQSHFPASISAPAASAPPPLAPPVPVPAPARVATTTKKKLPRLPSHEPSVVLATIGAVVAALIGMLFWYGFMQVTGIASGWIAWGVGAFVGLGTKMMGRGGATSFGAIAAVCALVAILGGRQMNYSNAISEFVQGALDDVYQDRVDFATRVAEAKSDDELRQILAEDDAEIGEMADPESISDEYLAEFKREERPELDKLLSGETTKAEFGEQLEALLRDEIRSETLFSRFGWFTVVFGLLGIASAYRIAAD